MKKHKSLNKTTKTAMFTGAAALLALVPQSRAQSAGDALIDKLEQKGILSSGEAKELRAENKQDFSNSFTNGFGKAFDSMMGTPGWVTGYKLSGDFRGRFDQISSDNNAFINRARVRYRLRFGIAVNMLDNLEAGFRLGSGDPNGGSASFGSTGSPLSNNSTMQDNFSKKMIYVDTAYGKWTVINSPNWLLSATFGKMDNPFNFTPMVFDPDLTPEGAAVQGKYTLNDQHNIAFTGAGFVLDEEKSSTRDPFLYGGQVMWNAKWAPKWTSTLGVGGFEIVNPVQLTTANVPYINQGNTRVAFIPLGSATTQYILKNNYNPVIADASVTYTLDTFPFYAGTFPVKAAGEYMNNLGTSANNTGYWVGVTFGKSGKKKTWDLTYRYEYLESDAWYDQLVDDDNGAFYPGDVSALAGSGFGGYGFYGGTNIKGHLVKFNYSLSDALTFTCTCFVNDLISLNGLAANVNVPDRKNSDTIHFMADLMWKF